MAKTRQTQNDPDYLKQGTDAVNDLADKVLGAVQQLTDKFVSTSRPVSIQDAVGREAEVSVGIPNDGAGEVIIRLSGSLRHYAARAHKEGQTFARGSKVLVIDVASDLVYVDEP